MWIEAQKTWECLSNSIETEDYTTINTSLDKLGISQINKVFELFKWSVSVNYFLMHRCDDCEVKQCQSYEDGIRFTCYF